MILNLPLEGIIVHNSSNSKSKLSLMSTASNHNQGIESSGQIMTYCQYSIQKAPPSTEGIRRKRKLLVTTGSGKGGLGQMGFQILQAE
jgi:hypothetical protein